MPLPALRLHLLSLIVLTCASGALLGLNLAERSERISRASISSGGERIEPVYALVRGWPGVSAWRVVVPESFQGRELLALQAPENAYELWNFVGATKEPVIHFHSAAPPEGGAVRVHAWNAVCSVFAVVALVLLVEFWQRKRRPR